MDILIVGQPSLARWRDRPFHDMTRYPTDHDDVYERDVTGDFERIAAGIKRYSIFPSTIVRPVIERPVQVGDVVGVHYVRFAPIRLFFCARVVDVFDREEDGWRRSGFTYRTLIGHPELGEETFCVERELATGRMRVALRSWSRPGTWLAKLGRPLVRRMQVSASHRALDHLSALDSDT